jgi:hypothetical protein
MKTLLQLTRDKIAEQLLKDGKDVSTLADDLPQELVLLVSKAMQKKQALDAMGSGDLSKLNKALADVSGYLGRMVAKWNQRRREMDRFAAQVAALRMRTKQATPTDEDRRALKQLVTGFDSLTKTVKKLQSGIDKITKFRALLVEFRRHLQEHRKEPDCAKLFVIVEELEDDLTMLLSDLKDVTERKIGKALDQLKKMQEAFGK